MKNLSTVCVVAVHNLLHRVVFTKFIERILALVTQSPLKSFSTCLMSLVCAVLLTELLKIAKIVVDNLQKFLLKMNNKIVALTVLLCVFTVAQCNLLFQCNDFNPKEPTKCGTNIAGAHNWTIHSTKTLPNVLSNVVDIFDVLYLDGNSSAPAKYRLNGISRYELGVSDTLCIQYATLSSDNCVNDPGTGAVCDANVTLSNSILGLETLPERRFTFFDQGWNVINFQFDLSLMGVVKRKSLNVLLHGFIEVGRTTPKSPPYIAIKFIQVNNNSCTDRIGPRSKFLISISFKTYNDLCIYFIAEAFWIAVMAIFCGITGLTFVAIAVQHIVFEHKKRTKQLTNKSLYM